MSAASGGAPIYCIKNKAELDELIESQSFASKLSVLIDFGIIVSRKIIDAFPLGIINSHFSLLPELRGADPISFAILTGKEKTGVSLMLLVEAMDEGPILSIGEQPLNHTETTPELTNSLILLSDSLLQNSIPKYISGDIKPANQSYVAEEFGRRPSYTRKLTKADGVIDWSKPAKDIEREVRAFAGWPKSRTSIGDIDNVITKVSISNLDSTPGELIIIDKELHIACGENSLQIEQLKPAGKKEMTAEAFLAGYKSRLSI